MSRSDQVIGVVDHSKWGRVSFATFAQIEQVSTIITDAKAPPELIEQLRNWGITVQIV